MAVLAAVTGSPSQWIFTGLVLLVVIQRGVELGISRRNIRWALERGGVEYGAAHYPWMVLVHLSFLLATPAEVWFLRRPFVPTLAVAMVLLLLAAMVCS